MSVLHARLRNNCSGINNDLFSNHISNNRLCDLCNVAEDAYHYFFQCRKYSVERQVFNDTVIGFIPLNINVILYGTENWNTEANMVLFRAVHTYTCLQTLLITFNDSVSIHTQKPVLDDMTILIFQI